MLRLRGAFDNPVPDLRMTCKIRYVNSAIRYAHQDTDLCPGMLGRWGIHLAE
jgi:hypothetical protein